MRLPLSGRPLWIGITLVVLAVLAGGYYFFVASGPKVEVVQPTRGPAVEAVYATGAVEPVFWAKVSSTTVGRIVKIAFKEGQQVKAGDILLQLDDREARARLAEAKANREFLEKELKRVAQLLERKIASEQQYQRILAQHAAAVAAEAGAKQRLQDLTLRAPLGGEVLRQDGNIGEVVKAGDVLFWIGKRYPMWIEAEVDEEDIPRVRKEQTVLVRADAFPGKSFTAVVSAITPKGDPVAKNYRVRVTLPRETPLRIGMTTEINIIVKKDDNALLVPYSALRKDHVFVVRDGRARRRSVTVGIVGDSKVQIVKGLSETDRVIADPPTGLKDGARVRARQAKAPAQK
jgi:RND family efflux transporter MFP subunit